MKNRWSDKDMAAFLADEGKSIAQELARQLYATRLLGQETDLVLHGGGNTSVKATADDLLGDTRQVLFVKASGAGMSGTTASDFVILDLKRLSRAKTASALSDETMAELFRTAMVRPHPRRASIETLLHAFLEAPYVDHTHPAAILALTNRVDAAECLHGVFGETVAVIPYPRVGLECACAAASAAAARPGITGLIIKHHGLVTWGDDAEEAYVRTINIVTAAEEFLAKKRTRPLSVPVPLSPAKAHESYVAIAPLLRGILTPPNDNPDMPFKKMVLTCTADEATLALLATKEAKAVLETTPLTPDYLIRTRRQPLFVENPALTDPQELEKQLLAARKKFIESYRSFVCAFNPDMAGLDDSEFYPSVVLLPGIGIVCSGETARDATIAADVTVQALTVKQTIHESGGTYADLGDDHLFDMEFRSYQRAKLSANVGRHGVMLVTGAAGAIGMGLCNTLLEAGCHVAVSDLAGENLDEAVAAFSAKFGADRVLSVPMDVTDQRSVEQGFNLISARFGGLDGAVVNAGIAHVALLADLDLETFRKLERVNIDGTLLTIREAAKVFGKQKTGGDIVLISTKNVFMPGASFGAYSATKAASHQLARIASQELAPLGVRVNMVAPDAVFSHGTQKSGLWAAVGPGRMKARGLDEAGLEEYYRGRNLLKARVTATHVANAVLFFLTHQTPTTGATIPVDGGLPDSTPR